MSTLRTALTDANWKIVQANGDPQGAGTTILREVTDLDMTVVDTLYATLLATTSIATSIVFDGQTYTGNFVVSTITALQDAQRTGTIRQQLTKVRDLSGASYAVTETMWQKVALKGSPDSNALGFQLVREVKYIDPAQAKSVIALLLAVESYDGSGVSPTLPKADSVVWPYLCINSSVDSRKEKDESVTIIQTLTRMVTYAAESVANTPAEADAILVQDPATPDDAGRTLIREWRWINPAVANATLAVVAGTASYSGPKADNVAHSGTYWNSAAVLIEQPDRTHTLRQTLTLTASTTAEADAKLVPSDATPDDAGHTLTREWRHIDPTAADTLFTTLKAVASYTDPKADNQTYTGVFWHSALNPIKQADGTVTIRQALTLTVATTANADAKLVSITGDPQVAGTKLTREWRHIIPTAADTLFTTALATTSVTNPQADGQAYTGTFAVSTLAPQKQADGTVTIKQVLTKVTDVTNYTALATLTPRVERGRVRVNVLQLSGWQSDYETVTLTYENLTVGSEAVLMDSGNASFVTDANCVTEADQNADDQGWTVLGRKFTKTDENVGVFVVNLAEQNYQTYDAGNRILTGRDNPLGFISTGTTVGMQRTETVSGLNAASIAADIAAQAVTTGYVIDSVRSQLQAGESVIVVTQTKVDDYGTGTDATTILAPTETTQRDAIGRQEATKQYVFRFVSPARVAAVLAAAKVIANYQHANWFTLAATYVVSQVETQHYANGSATITANLVVPLFSSQTDAYNENVNPDYKMRVQTSRVAKSLSGSPGVGTPYYRKIHWTRVTKVSEFYSTAQAFLRGTGWTATPWSGDARYVAFATSLAAGNIMGQGIRTVKLATGAQVYAAWVDVFWRADAWAAEATTTPAF